MFALLEFDLFSKYISLLSIANEHTHTQTHVSLNKQFFGVTYFQNTYTKTLKKPAERVYNTQMRGSRDGTRASKER